MGVVEVGIPSAPLGGMMNGKKDLTPAEQVKRALEVIKPRVLALAAQLRPWQEVLSIKKPDVDTLKVKIPANLVYFQANYCALGLSCITLSVFTSTSAIFLLGLLALFWTWFLSRNEDPDWVVVVANMPLQPKQRLAAAATVSVTLLLVFLGGVMLSAVGFASFLATVHAAVSSHDQYTEVNPLDEI
jgi:hypothetical protein